MPTLLTGRTLLSRYAMAVLIVALATGVRGVLLRSLGTHIPYITYYPAVLIAALYGGMGPSLLATLLATIGASHWLDPGTPPPGAPHAGSLPDYRWLSVCSFIINGTMISFFGQAALRSRERAALAEARNRAEAAFAESETRFRTFFESAVIGASQADPDTGRFLDVNEAFCRMTGYSREELLARSFADITHPDEAAGNLTDFRAHQREKEGSYIVEKRYLRKDGSVLWVQLAINFVRNAAAEALYAIGVITDISERKNAESESQRLAAELAERVAELQGVLDAAPVAVWIAHDVRCHWITGNAQADRFLRTARGGNVSLTPSAGDASTTHRVYRNGQELPTECLPAQLAVSTGAPVENEEYELRFPDGNSLHLLMGAVPLLDSAGHVRGAVVAGADISSRIHAEEALQSSERHLRRILAEQKQLEGALREARDAAEAASRAKGHFLAVLSHELRTPLTPVLTTVQMMEQDPTLSPEIRTSAQMIRRNVELETRLIDDLLDLTRIERGKMDLHIGTVDIHDKIRHVVTMCDHDMRSRQLRLVETLSATRHHVPADAAKLQQILWNLIKNAVKFTPVGGTITVRTFDQDDGRLTVTIQDTGVGIEASALPHIFNSFEQGGADVTRLFGGLGLGLSIAKGLVALHGGNLTASSEGKGLGSTFTLTLPVSSTAANTASWLPTAPFQSPQAGQTDGNNRRILLVEDHSDSARALSKLLKSCGYDVRLAESVASALQAVAAETFDLVISDIGLPDGSGLDLIRQVRLKSPIKAIALSGMGMEEDLERSREAGFSDHLTKPVNIDRLQAVVRRMMEPSNGDSRYTS